MYIQCIGSSDTWLHNVGCLIIVDIKSIWNLEHHQNYCPMIHFHQFLTLGHFTNVERNTDYQITSLAEVINLRTWKKKKKKFINHHNKAVFFFLNFVKCACCSSRVYAPTAGMCTGPRPRVPYTDVALHVRCSHKVNWNRARFRRPVWNHALLC